MFLKSWNRNKKKKNSFPFISSRTLPNGSIVIKTDMFCETTGFMDFLIGQFEPDPSMDYLLEVNTKLNQMAFPEEDGCSAIVVQSGSWEVYLTQDSNFELEV